MDHFCNFRKKSCILLYKNLEVVNFKSQKATVARICALEHLVIQNFELAGSHSDHFCPAIRMAPSFFKNFDGKTGQGSFKVLLSDLCSKN